MPTALPLRNCHLNRKQTVTWKRWKRESLRRGWEWGVRARWEAGLPSACTCARGGRSSQPLQTLRCPRESPEMGKPPWKGSWGYLSRCSQNAKHSAQHEANAQKYQFFIPAVGGKQFFILPSALSISSKIPGVCSLPLLVSFFSSLIIFMGG